MIPLLVRTHRSGRSPAVGLSERTVSSNLSRLAEAGVVVREGSRKKGKWVVISPFGSDDSS